MFDIANKIRLFSYSKKEWLIAIILLPPFAFVLNWVLFGRQYFSDLKSFFFEIGRAHV